MRALAVMLRLRTGSPRASRLLLLVLLQLLLLLQMLLLRLRLLRLWLRRRKLVSDVDNDCAAD
jgi:hypothetical protein